MKNRLTRERIRNIENTIAFLCNHGFSTSKDDIKEYSSKGLLYYLQLDNDTYLVINHFNFKCAIGQQGFDAWKSKYNRPSDIGSKSSKCIEKIKVALKMPEDMNLLMGHIEC